MKHFFFLVLWTEGHWASEKGHQAEWADLLWKLIVEADIGLLNAQSRPRLCVFLILTSFCFGEIDQLMNIGEREKGASQKCRWDYIYV